ncbi:MAG: flagellar FliJ family protein, partial [Desulfosarcina sp.]|nr:flagellar FliJ family protein [Desulfobacterales bacterium]
QKALEVMERRQRQYQQDLKSKMQNDGAADELFLYHRYLGRLGKEISSQAGLANELEAEKEEKRAQLLVALKNRKIIERLKERYLETEARKTRDQEQKLLNEVAANRYLAGRVNPCG